MKKASEIKGTEGQSENKKEKIRKAAYGTAGNLTAQSKYDKKTERKKGIIIRAIALLLLLTSIIGLVIMNNVGIDGDDQRVNVMFCDFDSDVVLPNSFIRVLRRAGFESEISDLKEDELISEEYDNEPVVVVTTGENALESVKRFASETNVIGFVLVDPVYPGNFQMAEFGKNFPEQNLAVFMPFDDSKTLNDLPDGKLIYERLSGDDTLFGNRIKQDSNFSSTVFISADQNRYLSVSAFDFADDGSLILMNPVFQNEFAQYLCTTYNSYTQKDYEQSMVFIEYILDIILIFVGIVGICLFMLGATRMTDFEKRRLFSFSKVSFSDIPKKYLILIASLSVLYLILIPIIIFLLEEPKILVYLCALIPILSALVQYMIVSDADAQVQAEAMVAGGIFAFEPIIMFFVQLVLLSGILYTLLGNNFQTLNTIDWIVSAVLIIIDLFVEIIRIKWSYMTSHKNIPGILVAVLVFILGIVKVDISLLLVAVALILLIVVPDFVEGNMRRLSKKTIVYALIHTLTYAIILLFLV
ncbi:MAG: hypothetical protein MJ153_07595 [Clostridia bacterium]|nr:hypothetical protein [Clostridia bacterium]